MSLPRQLAWLIGLAALVPQAALAGPVTGSIQTRVRQGATAATAIVYAERLDGIAPTSGGAFTLGQKNKTFTPRVLGVPRGAAVAFPNQDPIFHNVFSLSAPQPFDLGLYRAGDAKTRTFTEPAVYHVFCNIHPQMVALLVVAPSPWVTTSAADGTWRLDLPHGRYRITVLSERASPATIEISVNGAGLVAPAITLDESAGVAVQHLNKHGRPYPKSAYSDK